MEDFSVPADDDASTCHASLIYRTWQRSKRAQHMRCGNGFLAAANYEGGGAASKMSVDVPP